MPTDAHLAVLAELRVMAKALTELGGSGTVGDVARVSGLPRALCAARIKGAGLPAPAGVIRYFAYRRPAGCVRPKGGVWVLTDAGLVLAKGS